VEEQSAKNPKSSPTGPARAQSPDRRVGELLIEAELITPQQLDEALHVQAQKGGKLFEILIALKHLTKEALHTFLSKQSGVPSIDVSNYHIPRELLMIIPKAFAREHVVLPIDQLGKLLTVGMACPLDTATITELEKITGLRVKAMLCKFDDINAMLRRCYPSEEAQVYEGPGVLLDAKKKKAAPEPSEAPSKPPEIDLAPPKEETAPATAPRRPPSMRPNVMALIEQQDFLPFVSNILQQARAASDDPAETLQGLTAILSKDPAVAARLLRVANASAYGMPGRVTNVSLAIAVLGGQGTRAVMKSFDQAPVLQDSFRPVQKAYWLRSTFCAAAAMAVARASGRGRTTDAYTAGLLHDIGRLALPTLLPQLYAQVDGELPILDLVAVEEEIFGVAHPEVGYLLARYWQLPPTIAHAIRFHHHPDATESENLIALVALAAVMAEAFERDSAPSADCFAGCGDLLAQLSITVEKATQILDKTAAAFKQVKDRKPA